MAKVDKHPPGTPCWFDLMSDDQDRALTFYGDLFGWTFASGGEEAGGYAMALREGLPAAGIGRKPQDAQYPPCWTIYFATDSVEQSIERIKEAGGQVFAPPMEVVDFGRMAIAVDSTGAPFGLWQPGQHHGSGWIGDPGTMAWCEVNTRDAKGATAFYESVLGLKSSRMDTPDMEYYTLEDEQPRCGVMQMDDQWGDLPPHWMPYFAVTSADETAEMAKSLGGEVMYGAFDTPYGRIAVIKDPEGVVFSVVEPVS